MSAIHGWMHRVRVLLDPEAYAREVEREIRFHIELETMQKRGIGLDQIQAEIAARRQFGNVTYTREEVRRMTGLERLDRVRQNIHYAWRGLRNTPGFSAAVVLTLALGLGVNAAMFTFLDRVFVQPPAGVDRPDQVRRLYYDQLMRRSTDRIASAVMRYPHVRELARLADTNPLGVFTSFRDSITVLDGSRTIAVRRTLANAAYFRVLGVHPTLGRYFDPLEDRIETPANVAVISHHLWQKTLRADPTVIGRVVRIDDRPVTIIGVAGKGFQGIDLDRSDLWMPLSHYNTDPPTVPAWYDSFHNVFATIIRFDNAESERRFLAPATRAYQKVRIARYGFDTTGFLRTGPLTEAAGPGTPNKEVSISLRLGGVSLIILLIAIANVANLLLVRSMRRAREIAVRRALGVTRAQLFQQLFTESAVLTVMAGVSSILLAIWVGSALRALLLPRVAWASGPLDFRSASFVLAVTVVTGILVGVAPALGAWRIDVVSALRSGSRNAGFGRSRLRSTLLMAQAALSVLLLVGAGLFVKSLRNVKNIELGYDVDRTLIASTSGEKIDVSADLEREMPALIERVGRMSGVEAVATSAIAPMRGSQSTRLFLPGVDSLPRVAGSRGAWYVDVSPGYFRASGLRLIAGHDFEASDGSGIIVNQAMAAGWWPQESALGKCVVMYERESPCLPVIGVVENAPTMGIMDKEREAWLFVSTPSPHSESFGRRDELVVRADPSRHAEIAEQIRAEIAARVPRATSIRVRSMLTDLEPQLRPWRLGATLFTALGLLALVVATIGVYSVIAYSVSQRAHEMGVRIALGARIDDIGRLVIGEGLRTIAIGVAIGVMLALAGGKLIASLLYGISPRDPGVMIAAAMILGVTGVAASVLPALRAARVDPMTTLRVE